MFSIVHEIEQNWSDSQPFANVYSTLALGTRLTSNTDLQLNAAQRGMIVGGIVMNYGFHRLQPLDQETEESLFGFDDLSMFVTQMLLTDRIDSDRIPLSVEFDYSQNQPPIGTGSTETEHEDGPTRILNRKDGIVHQQFEEEATGASTGAWPVSQQISINTFQLNKRLKLRLDEEHGLYLATHLRRVNSLPAVNLNRGVRAWYRGTLYWRAVF